MIPSEGWKLALTDESGVFWDVIAVHFAYVQGRVQGRAKGRTSIASLQP